MPDGQSYSAEVRTTPPRAKTFPTGGDAAGALMAARRWVEDEARRFLEERSLPKNPWEAGTISGGEGSSPVASLSVYTSEDEYVFTWDDEVGAGG